MHSRDGVPTVGEGAPKSLGSALFQCISWTVRPRCGGWSRWVFLFILSI